MTNLISLGVAVDRVLRKCAGAFPILFPESTVDRLYSFRLFQDGEAVFIRTNREETWPNITGDIPLLSFKEDPESQIVLTPSVLSSVITNRLTQAFDYQFMISYNAALIFDLLM